MEKIKQFKKLCENDDLSIHSILGFNKTRDASAIVQASLAAISSNLVYVGIDTLTILLSILLSSLIISVVLFIFFYCFYNMVITI